jgi:hypothetical protein
VADPAVEMTTDSDERISVAEYAVRTAWIAVRLVLVYYLGQQGSLFFYQVF